MKILVDTREQRPLEFPGGVKVTRKKLDVGDYSIVGHAKKGIVIERKSKADFFGSFTRRSRREDMAAKLDRMGDYARSYLLVEATAVDISFGTRYSEVDGLSLLAEVADMCAARGVCVLLADDADTASKLVLGAFRSYLAGTAGRYDESFRARKSRVYSS